ncbi:hypothetical protein ACJIZ3_024728 [Penstemon smallii]|uniref:Uncharacterized protein n=1 Tax=Penstemon smallii TaxID=265156 RepID=A0ABD3TSR2_9LAMI
MQDLLKLGLGPSEIHWPAEPTRSTRPALSPIEQEEKPSKGYNWENQIPNETQQPVSGFTLRNRNINTIHC